MPDTRLPENDRCCKLSIFPIRGARATLKCYDDWVIAENISYENFIQLLNTKSDVKADEQS